MHCHGLHRVGDYGQQILLDEPKFPLNLPVSCSRPFRMETCHRQCPPYIMYGLTCPFSSAGQGHL